MDISPFHPLVVHFPIAALIVAALFDLVALVIRRPDLSAAALYVQAIGALAGVASYLTGEAAEEGAERMAERVPAVEAVLERHEDLGKIVMWAALAVVALRIGLVIKGKMEATGAKAAIAALSLGLAVLVGATGFFGGKLVYEHGVGIAAPAGVGAPVPAGHDEPRRDDSKHDEPRHPD